MFIVNYYDAADEVRLVADPNTPLGLPAGTRDIRFGSDRTLLITEHENAVASELRLVTNLSAPIELAFEIRDGPVEP